MKKRITGLFAATLLALSMLAVPAMADGHELPPPPTGDGECTAAANIASNPGLHQGVPDDRRTVLADEYTSCHGTAGFTHPGGDNPNDPN